MGEVAPVAAGLAVGIAFVVAFSVFAGSASSFRGPADNEKISITIHDLKNTYRIGEPISFTVITKGVSDNLCNGPKLHVQIIRMEDNKGVWNTPPTFQTAMGCNNLQDFDAEWLFGYPGEELPYQSAINDRYYENKIAIEKAGSYKLVAEFDDHTIEKEFLVAGSANEVISLSKGCFGLCHIHSIFIFGNSTTIHREYEREGSKIYIFQIPMNETARLFRQFYEADLSMPKIGVIGTDIILTQMSFTAADGKTTKLFYRDIPSTPQTILNLDLQIEQLVERYDDRVVDCTDSSIKDCPVHEPQLDESDAETGLFIPDDKIGVGDPIEVFEANDNSTAINIEYNEDN